MAQCHNVRGEDGPCDCAGCQEVAALRRRVEELERQHGFTCQTMQQEISRQTQRAEAAEAKLARCVEAMEQIVANLPPDWELVETARVALAEARE